MSYSLLDTRLDRCFDAVSRPEDWPGALHGLARALGGAGAAFNSPTVAGQSRLRLPASPRYAALLAEFIGDGWAAQDLRARRGWAMARTGRRVLFEDDVTTADERAGTAIYRDLFARHQAEAFVGSSFLFEGQPWNLNLIRGASEGAFTARDRPRLLAMQPTLRRLLLFARHMAAAEARGALEALEQVAVAAAVLDPRGLVLQVNTTAEALMGQGLDLRGGRLAVAEPAVQTALEAQAAAACAGRMVDAVIVRRLDRDPLVVEAVPLKGYRMALFGTGGALLLITDTEARPGWSAELIRRAFGLTAREGAVAEALVAGESIQEVAERMALRESSLRQVVKAVMEKTDTRRQGELIAKLARLPKDRR
jgi:DNA-binding CsgD family transcriptional regulator